MQNKITPEERWKRLLWAHDFALGQTFLPIGRRFALSPGMSWEERLADIRRDLKDATFELALQVPFWQETKNIAPRPC